MRHWVPGLGHWMTQKGICDPGQDGSPQHYWDKQEPGGTTHSMQQSLTFLLNSVLYQESEDDLYASNLWENFCRILTTYLCACEYSKVKPFFKSK